MSSDLNNLKHAHLRVLQWLREKIALAQGPVAFTYDEIAEGSGVSRRTVCRALIGLKRNNLIVAREIKYAGARVYELPAPLQKAA